jgi:antitoxin (DNA-binding transcriptional repressor) of toxin-antitoxin stability system
MQVDVKEAQVRLSDLIDQAIKGEVVVISKGEGSLVRLVPISGVCGHPVFGSAKGLIEVSDDFDAPLDDFQLHMK